MIPYITCFTISSLLLAIGSKTKGKKHIMIFTVAVLLPCILAGLRLYNIGTDVKVYVKPIVDIAKMSKSFNAFYNANWWYYWDYKFVSQFEIGYIVLLFTITKVFKSLQWSLFFIHVIIIVPVFCGLRKYKELEGKEWLSMLVFYLMFYNVSLNAMRQYMSLSLLFYGLSCLINEKKQIKFFLFLILALLFHKTAILGIMIYVIYMLCKDGGLKNHLIGIGRIKIKLSLLISSAFLAFFVVGIYNTEFLESFLKLIGFERYAGYIDGDVSFSVNSLIKVIPIIGLYLFNRKNYSNSKDSYFYIYMFICAFFLNQFSTASAYGGRVAYGFELFNIIFFTKLCFATKNNRKVNYCFLLAYLCFYWWFYFVYGGSNETVPYLFFWNEGVI